MIYVWDEIGGKAMEVEGGSNEDHPNIEVDGKLIPVSWGLSQTVPDYEERNAPELDIQDWMVNDVIDLPDGTRIVIENDHRAHTAVLVTTKED